ncbi:MAG: serine/threonine-protein kinase [Euzebya sp.]
MNDDTVDLGIDDLTDAVEVGAGGFGTVYKAHQESLRRDVAVKIVANTVKERKVRIRFEREIQAMGMLSGHPNIVTVYDSGFTASGQPYILMDYMEQGSLGDRLDKDGSVPYTDVLDIMVKVCGALETAHQAGILHRDLKPENVLVSAYGEPKLGDFGIARLKGGPETGTSSLTASIEHVAPELLEAHQPHIGSDLYALGSTMYKLLTGEAAFLRPGDESIVPALTRIRDEAVPDLRARGVPPQVAAVVERAMAKDPTQRFASAAEMGQVTRNAQQLLGLMPTALPVREEEAAVARETTRTIQSDDIVQSIDDIRQSNPVAWQQGPTGGYPPQQQPYQPQAFTGGGYPQQPVPTGSTTPWGKIVAGVGALVVVAGIGTAVALSAGGNDQPTEPPTTPPTSTPPTATALPEYPAYERLTDDSESITVDVPRLWSDVDGSAWMVDDMAVGPQIEASPDIEGFRNTWAQPGLIFGSSGSLRQTFDPAQLLDAVSFTDQCTYDGRQPYSDAAYTGFRDDYSNCGNTDTTYHVIAAEPASHDRILLVQLQAVEHRDDAALQRTLDSFFVLPDEAAATAAATEDGQ